MSRHTKPFQLDVVKEVLRDRVSSAQPPSTSKSAGSSNPAVNPADDAMQQPIVGYKVIEKMGSGGMAVVFKAEDMNTGNIVALKLLYPGKEKDRTILQQFVNEGMMLIRLDHPNILKGLDFGVSKGMYFLTLEFIQGESLNSFLEKKLLFTEYYAFEVALQIAKALAYLEKNHIVHRDVKPANILLIEETVKLCDFAFAMDTTQMKDEKGLFDNTCGTVEYISPEQARGCKDIDIRSDVYSLGITCIHMITGQLPFSGSDPTEVMRQQIYEAIPWKKYQNISSQARSILRAMLTKKKEERILPSKLVIVLGRFLEACREKMKK